MYGYVGICRYEYEEEDEKGDEDGNGHTDENVHYDEYARSCPYEPVPKSGLGLASPPRFGASPLATYM